MTTTKLLNSAQFITDKDGNKTAVLLDVDTWEEIVTAMEKLDTLEAASKPEGEAASLSPLERDQDSPEDDAAWAHLSSQNQKALALLQEWTSKPSDKDDAWWDDFEQELRDTRLNFQREVDLD